MSSITQFIQPVSYQSYNLKGEYETIKTPNEDGIGDYLALEIRTELQI